MPEIVRTAVYARVSVITEQTEHSLQAQISYFKDRIGENMQWELVDVYADCGVTGTDLKKRTEFQRMLADCEVGKINRILVKSVSRFARNTVDLLAVVRRLKNLGISVWFEEQHIDSLTAEGELMLTLMASVAQAESETISENIKWAVRKGFQKGIGNTKRRTFGYRWVEDRQIIIPEEAATVRRIYEHFLAGGSHMKMAETLNREGVTSVYHRPIAVSTISAILRNITYTGNTLLQKTYIQDPISKKKRKNTGELPQYFVQNTHEAIIDMETFQKVQEKFAYNKKQGRFPYNHTGRTYPFTGKVLCGCCGRHYTRQVWTTGRQGKKRTTWICTGKKAEVYRRCYAENITEEQLMKASTAVLGLTEFSGNTFKERVDSVIVYEKERLFFRMKSGEETAWTETLQI